MSFALTLFGTTAVPTGSPVLPVGSAPSQSGIVDLPGSFYDGFGTDQAPQKLPYELGYRCTLWTDPEATVAGLPVTLHTDVDAWRVLRGTRAALTRVMAETITGVTGTQWCWARLLQVRTNRQAIRPTWQDAELVFVIESPWYGVLHDDTYLLDDPGGSFPHTQTIMVANVGTMPISSLIATVTAGGGANISGFTLRCRDIDGVTVTEMAYTGTVYAGTSVVIDGGAWSVKNAGVNDYAHWAPTANHTLDEWFRFAQSGITFIDLVRTWGGAGDTLGLRWYDQYE